MHEITPCVKSSNDAVEHKRHIVSETEVILDPEIKSTFIRGCSVLRHWLVLTQFLLSCS